MDKAENPLQLFFQHQVLDVLNSCVSTVPGTTWCHCLDIYFEDQLKEQKLYDRKIEEKLE